MKRNGKRQENFTKRLEHFRSLKKMHAGKMRRCGDEERRIRDKEIRRSERMDIE